MRVSKSTPLVLYLLKHDIDFKTDESELVIKDEDYKSMVKNLSKDQNRKWMIKSMQIEADEKIEPKVRKGRKPRQHEAFKRVIEDAPKTIRRPPAVYSNPNYKTMYL